MNEKRKTVLITGASGGIGKATAIQFANIGMNVILHYNTNLDAAKNTLAELKHGDHMIISSDLKFPGEIENMVEEIYCNYSHVDILVNNAGVYIPETYDNLNFDLWKECWEKTIQTNLTGAGNLSFLIGKKMIDQGVEGRIINISSRGAFRGEPDAIAYGASKAGLNALGQSMARALGKYGITVFTIAPGFVATEMSDYVMNTSEGERIKEQSPLNRIATTDEVAETILFCATTNAKFMTGSIIDINGASYLRT